MGIASETKQHNVNMAQQTAVEWLQIKMATSPTQEMVENINVWFQQAKQMEEQQHQETFKQSRQEKIFEDGMPPVWESFEQYYNETFGKS